MKAVFYSLWLVETGLWKYLTDEVWFGSYITCFLREFEKLMFGAVCRSGFVSVAPFGQLGSVFVSGFWFVPDRTRKDNLTWSVPCWKSLRKARLELRTCVMGISVFAHKTLQTFSVDFGLLFKCILPLLEVILYTLGPHSALAFLTFLYCMKKEK